MKKQIRSTTCAACIGMLLMAGGAVAETQPPVIDEEVQDLKAEVLSLNREFFALDSVQLTLDGKDVSNYLYTDREVTALHRGGVHKLFLGNVKTGEHELVAIFTGEGPQGRDYKRGATVNFNKAIGAKFVELQITDREIKQQPEFFVREWE